MNIILSPVFSEFVEWIKRWPTILALVLCVLGVTIAILARRITRVVRKNNEVSDNDGVFITLKVVSIALLFAALLIVVFV